MRCAGREQRSFKCLSWKIGKRWLRREWECVVEEENKDNSSVKVGKKEENGLEKILCEL